MAQTTQIIPKFSFPYVESHINDYSFVSDEPESSNDLYDNTVRFIFPFISGKGVDNVWVKKKTLDSFKSTYGNTNYKKYGQPIMMPLALLGNGNCEVWCMRVMPENASYAHNIISMYYKVDPASIAEEVISYVATASTTEGALLVVDDRVVSYDFCESTDEGALKIVEEVSDPATEIAADDCDGADHINEYVKKIVTVDPSLVDDANTKVGYSVVSADSNLTEDIIGDYVLLIVSEETIVDPRTRKFHIMFKQTHGSDCLKTDDVLGLIDSGEDVEGWTRLPFMAVYSNGRGSYGNDYHVRMSMASNYEKNYGIKFNNYEVLTTENGLSKVATYVGGACTSTKYSVLTFINDILGDVGAGVAPLNIYIEEDSMDEVYNAYVEFIKDQNERLKDYRDAHVFAGASEETLADIDKYIYLTGDEFIPDEDTFDVFFGKEVNSTKDILMLSMDEGDVSFDSVSGIALYGGGNGYFDAPRQETVINPGTGAQTTVQWTLDDEIEYCYNAAFSGEYDKRILAPKRIQASALMDANYPMSVKATMVELATLRNDSICYLDYGMMKTLSANNIDVMIEDFSVFDTPLVSKNMHCYQVRETTTNKKVWVTITYFLAQQLAYNLIQNGTHIPLVKARCQLAGHVKESLKPSIEEYESDVKERLYNARINYFETVDDNLYQRSTQSTSQIAVSDMSEESNVLTLYTMKRIVETYLTRNLYDFSDETVRNDFRNYVKALFANWVGSRLQSFDVEFRMNKWESEHSIIHAYIVVVFRGIFKQAIVEIDINKRDYVEDNTDEE